MRAGDKAAGGQILRRDDPDERIADAERQQSELLCIEKLLIAQRAHRARQLEPLERHAQPAGERADVVVLRDDARGDQHAVGADPERDGALLGGGKVPGGNRPRRQSSSGQCERARLCGPRPVRLGSGTKGRTILRRRRSLGVSRNQRCSSRCPVTAIGL